MLDYIIEDFEKSRIIMNDYTLGGMVVCDSYDQAKEMFKIFNQKYKNNSGNTDKKVKSAELILYDEGTKEDRKDRVNKF